MKTPLHSLAAPAHAACPRTHLPACGDGETVRHEPDPNTKFRIPPARFSFSLKKHSGISLKTRVLMKQTPSFHHRPGAFVALIASLMITAAVAHAAGTSITGLETEPKASAAIPWSEIGAKAGADYSGDGLAISQTEQGAWLRCVFQKLAGEATAEGLWLDSTVPGAVNDRFRITAASVGRVVPCAPPGGASGPASRLVSSLAPPDGGQRTARPTSSLPTTGNISVAGKTVRFTRPGLVEEYSVSMDGVRQDFVVLERPPGGGELRLQLDASGARAEPAHFGARLVLENSGRKIAYSRLLVVDATGRELPARIEVIGSMAAPAVIFRALAENGRTGSLFPALCEGAQRNTRGACARAPESASEQQGESP